MRVKTTTTHHPNHHYHAAGFDRYIDDVVYARCSLDGRKIDHVTSTLHLLLLFIYTVSKTRDNLQLALRLTSSDEASFLVVVVASSSVWNNQGEVTPILFFCV